MHLKITLFLFCHNVALSQVQLFIHIISPFSQVLLCTMQFLSMFLLFWVFCFLPKCTSSPSLYGILRLSPANNDFLSLILVKFFIFFTKVRVAVLSLYTGVEYGVILWLRFTFIWWVCTVRFLVDIWSQTYTSREDHFFTCEIQILGVNFIVFKTNNLAELSSANANLFIFNTIDITWTAFIELW